MMGHFAAKTPTYGSGNKERSVRILSLVPSFTMNNLWLLDGNLANLQICPSVEITRLSKKIGALSQDLTLLGQPEVISFSLGLPIILQSGYLSAMADN